LTLDCVTEPIESVCQSSKRSLITVWYLLAWAHSKCTNLTLKESVTQSMALHILCCVLMTRCCNEK